MYVAFFKLWIPRNHEHYSNSLTLITSIIFTRRTASPACYLERFLSWCKYHIWHNDAFCLHKIFFQIIYLSAIMLFIFSLVFPFFSPCSQLLFVVGFTVFLANCVDYDILFANKFVNRTDSSKVTLPDAFLPVNVCSARWLSNVISFFQNSAIQCLGYLQRKSGKSSMLIFLFK